MLNVPTSVKSLLYGTTTDFHDFLNQNQTTYNFLDVLDTTKPIKGLSLRTNAGLLINSIRGKQYTGEVDDEEFDLNLKIVDNGRAYVK